MTTIPCPGIGHHVNMNQEKKDTIFNIDNVGEDFAFTEKVVEVFDDMLDRSVPFYGEVIRATAQMLAAIVEDNDTIVDLGCSTGTTLLEFSRVIDNDSVSFTGVDNSASMLQKGRMKAEMYSKSQKISFEQRDITTLNMENIGSFICNYTMQFIRPVLRENFLGNIFSALRPGGALFLSEKTICHDTFLNRRFIDIYHAYKKNKGYSELEIAKKREALENVLIPFSIEENRELLRKVGFTPVETYFQWFNFVSILAIKPV